MDKLYDDEEMRRTIYERLSGESIRKQFIENAYHRLMRGENVTTIELLANIIGKSVEDYLKRQPYPTYDVNYNQLKNAMSELRKFLEWKGKGHLISKDDPKNKLCKIYYYESNCDDADPLRDEFFYVAKLKIQDYINFCKSSNGFMPDAWFSHFFQRTPILLDTITNKEIGNEQIHSGANPILKNIEMLPELYEHIQKHEVLKVTETPFVKEQHNVILHPQFLKEYNGRWYIFGQGQRVGIDKEPIDTFCLPLDRIKGEIEVTDENYIPAEPGKYDTYFNNIIGVTHGFYDGNENILMGEQEITIRIHNRYMYGLISTKKFHHSQKESLSFGKQSDGKEYGEITLKVDPNNELIGKILQMGTSLEVISPYELRKRIKQDILVLSERYK